MIFISVVNAMLLKHWMILTPIFYGKTIPIFQDKQKAILKHFDEFAEQIIHNYSIDKKINVLDIGSNDGSLLETI